MFRQTISTENSAIEEIEITFQEFSKNLPHMMITFKNSADIVRNKALADQLKEATGFNIHFKVTTPEEVQEKCERSGIVHASFTSHSLLKYFGTIEDFRKIVQELLRLREISDTDEYPNLITNLAEITRLTDVKKIAGSITIHQYELIVVMLEAYVPDVVKLLSSYEKIISLFNVITSQNMAHGVNLFCAENTITFPNEYFKDERELTDSLDAIKKILKGNGLKTTFDRVATAVPDSKTIRHAVAYYIKTLSQKYFYPDISQPIDLTLQKRVDSELLFFIGVGLCRQQYNKQYENPIIMHNPLYLAGAKEIAENAEKAISEKYKDTLSDPVTFTIVAVKDEEKIELKLKKK